MAVEVAIIVTDAPPLITLAAAQSLDYLLYPALPVIIPDAVFHEATAAAGKLGAQEILEWYRAHTMQVRVEPTDIFREEILLREVMPGRKLVRDLGERAAIEVIRNYPLPEDGRALLLSDDRDAGRLLVFEPEKTILLTTWDYLRQLEEAQRITSGRLVAWHRYHEMLAGLEQEGLLRRPIVPANCQQNGHLYYVLLAPGIDRQEVLGELKRNGIGSVFHYVPLHSSPAGMRFGRSHGDLLLTTTLSQRLIRLPMWFGLSETQQQRVAEVLRAFLHK